MESFIDAHGTLVTIICIASFILYLINGSGVLIGCIASLATTLLIIFLLVLVGKVWIYVAGIIALVIFIGFVSGILGKRKVSSNLAIEAGNRIKSGKELTILDFINIYKSQNSKKIDNLSHSDMVEIAKGYIKVVPGNTINYVLVDIENAISAEKVRIFKEKEKEEKERQRKLNEEFKKQREKQRIRDEEEKRRKAQEEKRKKEETENNIINQNISDLITNIIYPDLKKNEDIDSLRQVDIGTYDDEIGLLKEHLNFKYRIAVSKEELKQRIKNSYISTLIAKFKREIGIVGNISADAVLSNFINYLGTSNVDNFSLICLANIMKRTKPEAENMLEARIKKLEYQNKMSRFEDRLKKASSSLTIEQIDGMDGYSFEDALRDMFKSFDFQVQHTSYSGDNGADIILGLPNKKVAIQAKNYTGNVGNAAVQEIVAAKIHYKCDVAMVITNSYFTKQAVELASSNNVILVDRDSLIKLLNEGRMYFINLCSGYN